MSNEIKEKEEYEKYARDHRKELDAQEVRLGDVVTVLVGHFAGEKGVIVGISACHNDYSDPYYEVDMNCEVPEKYKCRKTLISPNNVIGGLSAHEFEVIGNCAPKQPSMEIKQGDKVRVSENAPSEIIKNEGIPTAREFTVTTLGGYYAEIKLKGTLLPTYFCIPTKYLVKVDAEAKEANVKIGSDKWVDKTVWNYKNHKKGVIRRMTDGVAEVFTEDGKLQTWQIEDLVDEYDDPIEKWKCPEPTAPKIKVGDRVRSKGYGLEAVVLGVYGDYIAVRRDDGIKQEWKRYMTELVEPKEQTVAEKKPNVGSIKIPVEVDLTDSYWDAYTADLAKEVALKVANKFNNPEQAAEYAVSVAKAVVEGLKRK